MLTPPLDSIKTITDSHSIYRAEVVNTKQSGGGEGGNVHGIPPASDIHISKVCKSLYMK